MPAFGLKQDTLHVRLPLLVQPQLPRFVREGDRFWGGGVARLLEGAEGPVSVDIDFGRRWTAPAKPRAIALATNRRRASSSRSRCALGEHGSGASIDHQWVGVTRKSDGQGDAFEVKLPVLPDWQVEKYAYVDPACAEG